MENTWWHGIPNHLQKMKRQSVVIKNNNGEILVKQIAGALAKRIINYLEVDRM